MQMNGSPADRALSHSHMGLCGSNTNRTRYLVCRVVRNAEGQTFLPAHRPVGFRNQNITTISAQCRASAGTARTTWVA